MTHTNSPRILRIFFVLTIVFLVLSVTLTLIYRSERKRAESIQNKYENLQNLQFSCSRRADSLLKEATMLNTYRTLSLAMTHRDEATGQLKMGIGDAAYMKRDSSRVLISDIVIGGSRYQYYIRYRVVNRQNEYEEVIPELLFQ